MADGTMAFCNKQDNETDDQNGLRCDNKDSINGEQTPECRFLFDVTFKTLHHQTTCGFMKNKRNNIQSRYVFNFQAVFSYRDVFD